MCRWIAYTGEAIALERYMIEPANSLLLQSHKARESVGAINADGFGLGWYGDGLEPGLYREIRPAWSDENLRHLCRHLKSSLFFGHVRAATGTPTTRPNCHPFSCREWLFMHNGYVAEWDRLRRHVEGLIDDRIYPLRLGTTDSEALFLAIMSTIGKDSTAGPVDATRTVLKCLHDLLGGEGGHPFRFTAALSDGQRIYAFRYALNDPSNTLYFQEGVHGTIIVSEPLDLDRNRWTAVPEQSVVIAEAGKTARVVPIF